MYFLLCEPQPRAQGFESGFSVPRLEKNKAKTSHLVQDGQWPPSDTFCQNRRHCDKKCFLRKKLTRIVIFFSYSTIFVSLWGLCAVRVCRVIFLSMWFFYDTRSAIWYSLALEADDILLPVFQYCRRGTYFAYISMVICKTHYFADFFRYRVIEFFS